MRKPSCERYTLTQSSFFFTQLTNVQAMARHIFLQLSILKIIQLCTFTVLMCFPKPSASAVCGDKTFIMSPLYNDLEPVELPTKLLNDSSRTLCSTKCYNDVTCSGFVYHYDGECSIFSTRFHGLSFVKKPGTQSFGE